MSNNQKRITELRKNIKRRHATQRRGTKNLAAAFEKALFANRIMGNCRQFGRITPDHASELCKIDHKQRRSVRMCNLAAEQDGQNTIIKDANQVSSLFNRADGSTIYMRRDATERLNSASKAAMSPYCSNDMAFVVLNDKGEPQQFERYDLKARDQAANPLNRFKAIAHYDVN